MCTSIRSRRCSAAWRFLSIAALLLIGLVFPTRASAQSSMTEELTEARKLDVSFDFLGSVARRKAGGFEWYLPSASFGVTDRLEIGGSMSTLVPKTAEEPNELIPHARWQWLETSKGQTAVIGGDWHFPLSNRGEADGYGLIDVTTSQTFGERRPVTISGGLYALVGRRMPDETRRGVILSWDQTVSKRWSYSVEWTSGNNWYGYMSAGLTFSSGAAWIFGGYCVGNQMSANHGPCVSAGRTF
jgi:hypothetical protein